MRVCAWGLSGVEVEKRQIHQERLYQSVRVRMYVCAFVRVRERFSKYKRLFEAFVTNSLGENILNIILCAYM